MDVTPCSCPSTPSSSSRKRKADFVREDSRPQKSRHLPRPSARSAKVPQDAETRSISQILNEHKGLRVPPTKWTPQHLTHLRCEFARKEWQDHGTYVPVVDRSKVLQDFTTRMSDRCLTKFKIQEIHALLGSYGMRTDKTPLRLCVGLHSMKVPHEGIQYSKASARPCLVVLSLKRVLYKRKPRTITATAQKPQNDEAEHPCIAAALFALGQIQLAMTQEQDQPRGGTAPIEVHALALSVKADSLFLYTVRILPEFLHSLKYPSQPLSSQKSQISYRCLSFGKGTSVGMIDSAFREMGGQWD